MGDGREWGTFTPTPVARRDLSAWLLEQLRITKTRRTAYDDLMLKLHDGAKLDATYQQSVRKTRPSVISR